MAWLDTGTHRGLLDAANYVEAVQTRQGLYVSCLEEIAYKNNWITRDDLEKAAETFKKSAYGEHLYNVLNKQENSYNELFENGTFDFSL